MITSDVAGRILMEVTRGVVYSTKDTEEERAYREDVAREVKEIVQGGGGVETPKEFVDFRED